MDNPTCVDYVLQLINCLPFNFKSSPRNKMDPSSTSVSSALEILNKGSNLGSESGWIPIRVGLEFIQTFLTFIPRWSAANEVVREHLGDLVNSLEDAFETAGLDIERAIKEGDGKHLDSVQSSLLEKIELFKPRIRETYDFFSEYTFQTTSPAPPVTVSSIWFSLCDGLQANALSLNSQCRLSTHFYMQFKDIVSAVRIFGEVHMWIDHSGSLWDLGFHVQGLAICLARLLFLWWVDEMDEDKQIIMLADLLQKMKPTSPQLLDMYVKVITRQTFYSKTQFCYYLLAILFFIPRESLEGFLNGLLNLVLYLVNHIQEDEKQLRSDIQKFICDAAARNYFSIKPRDDEQLLLFQLLQMIELSKLEFAITRLILQSGGHSLSYEAFLRAVSIRRLILSGSLLSSQEFKSIHQGLTFLQTYLKCTENVNSERLILIFNRIEQVAMEAESLCTSIQQNEIKVGSHRDVLRFKLFLDVRLTKIQVLMMEQMTICSPGLILPLKDKIQMLDEGLELLHKYNSVILLDKPGAKKMIWTNIQSLALEEKLFYHFFQSNQVREDTIDKLSILISNLLEKVNLLNSEIQGPVLQFQNSSVNNLPKTHQGLGFVDIFLDKLSWLMKYMADSMGYSMNLQVETVLRGLESLRSFLEEVGEKPNENPELKNLRRRVTQAAYRADYIIDLILHVDYNWCYAFGLSNVLDEIKVIKSELTKIKPMTIDSAEVREAVETSAHIRTQTGTPEVGEVVICLRDQEEIIIDRLQRGSSQRRQVVTIVGMPGIGKTTLARKVYENPQIKNYFHRRAWCCVSQAYQKRELLLKILNDIVQTTEEIHNKSDQDLLEMIYRGLKGKRYLVVMDDVWGTQAWEELGTAFPDDYNGSRILFTSRYEKVALQVQHDGVVHHLRFLTEDESWILLQKKVFDEETCPEELNGIGWAIAKSCKGLPLAVVAIAGLLKRTDKRAEWWKQIEEELNSRILEDPESQCMHILELSYNHLPDDLKPCFLYFAAFREDDEVPVQKLIQLWIAEGFIRRVDQKASLEDVAESYVMDLIARSLLMAARRGSNGGVKACKVHDMLHNLCLRKVEEDKFLQNINGYEKLFPSSTSQLDYGDDSEYPPISITYKHYRLSICARRNQFVMLKPSGPVVRTLLFFPTSDTYPRCPYDDVSFIADKFKLLRVLDIEGINIGYSFPKGIELLDPLRYLAISGDLKAVPSSIAKLWNLETFILKGLRGKVALPDTIWGMSRLRHLHVNTRATFSLQDGGSSQLDSVVTLSSPVLSHGNNSEIMKKFPKLRKLRCIVSGPVQHSEDCISFRVPDILTELKSLKIIYSGGAVGFCQFSFPSNLKKLSLSDFSLKWDDFSAIGELSNLKVLKLLSIAFDSEIWEMKDDEFQQLEYLKLDSLKISEWNASNDHLPNLEQLVLRSCSQLEEVPSCFGEIPTLQMIELKWCNSSAETSVNTIREQQFEYGNNGFKTIINDQIQMFNPDEQVRVA